MTSTLINVLIKAKKKKNHSIYNFDKNFRKIKIKVKFDSIFL